MPEKYISDVVGEEFKSWEPGANILLSAPTGSGKTTFVLKTLLPYCVKQGMEILYLVNRTALKEQLEKIRSNEVPPEYWGNICIETYQLIENEIHNLYYSENWFFSNGMNNISLRKYKKYDWIICDEAHYFLADSTFNTYTMSSYYFVHGFFGDKIKVFMSATIDELSKRIEKDFKRLKNICTSFYCLSTEERPFYSFRSDKNKSYSIERDYSYVDIEIISSYSQIPQLVFDSNDKWLVFVDSIEKGNELKKQIKIRNKESERERTVAFITSKYVLDEEAASEMGIIIDDSKQSVDILIATSVLDNGINLKDSELRNVIAIADTETEFIQMIGRKRTDDKKTKVYLYKHSKEHFQKRYSVCDREYKEAWEYFNKIEKEIDNLNQRPYYNVDAKLRQIDTRERVFIQSQTKYLLQRVMQGNLSFKTLKSCFFELDGCLLLNTLSMEQLKNLRTFYREMVNKFDTEGEDAFYIEQLSWLRKPSDCLIEAKKNEFERAKELVLEVFKNTLKEDKEVVIEKNEWVEKTNEMEKALEILFDSIPESEENCKTISEIVSRNNVKTVKKYAKAVCKELGKKRPLNSIQIKVLYAFFNIPYDIKVEGKNYTISQRSSD